MSKLGFPVFDADNHLYETEEAFTRHLPSRHKGLIKYVQVNGRTKIAVSRASTLDCHDAGPKCAISGRSHQSGEFTVLRVSGSWVWTTVSFVSKRGDSYVGHTVARA